VSSWSGHSVDVTQKQFKIIPPGMSFSPTPNNEIIYLNVEEAIFLNINYEVPISTTKDFWSEELTASTAFGIRYILPEFDAKLWGLIPAHKKDNDILLKDLILEGAKIFLTLSGALTGLTLGSQWAANFAPMITEIIASLTASGMGTVIGTLISAIEHRGRNWSSATLAKLNFFQTTTGFATFAGLIQNFQLLQGPFKKYLPASPWSAMLPNTLYVLLYALTAGKGAPIANQWAVRKLFGYTKLTDIIVPEESMPLLPNSLREEATLCCSF
jgi:hypothetical protein